MALDKQNRNGAAETEVQSYHVPVMLKQAVDGLGINPSGTYVDCTFGGGGHSREILSRLNEKGRLFAFDQDEDARVNLTADTRLVFIPHNFRHLTRFLRLHGVTEVDGILADLGVSSHQFDQPSRGFSIRFDAPLDMRMDQSAALTAADFIQQSSAESLQLVFQEYGEVTNARTLAQLLTEHCRKSQIRTINELKAVIAPVVKGNPNKYFAQVFQSLRIAVNDELAALKDLLVQSASLIRPGGGMSVITFHSLEDRIVKQFFKSGDEDAQVADHVYGTRKATPFEPFNRKPIEPSTEEVSKNPRSRSARLRIGVKK